MNLTLKCVSILSGTLFLVILLLVNISVLNEQNGGGPTTTLSHTNDLVGPNANCPENFFDIRSVGVLSDGAWQAVVTTNSPWVRVIPPAAGKGNGFVQYRVEANLTPYIRVAIIDIGGQQFSVVQGAFDETIPCPIQTDKSHFQASSRAEAIEFNLTDEGLNLEWRADVYESDWMEFNPANGTGSGSTTLFISDNPSASARMGLVEIGGKKIPIIQGGGAAE